MGCTIYQHKQLSHFQDIVMYDIYIKYCCTFTANDCITIKIRIMYYDIRNPLQ